MHRVFDHDFARGSVLVTHGIRPLLAIFRSLHQSPTTSPRPADALPLLILLAVYRDAKVDGIREQALLIRLYRIHQALAGESITLENVEAATIEGQAAGVREP